MHRLVIAVVAWSMTGCQFPQELEGRWSNGIQLISFTGNAMTRQLVQQPRTMATLNEINATRFSVDVKDAPIRIRTEYWLYELDGDTLMLGGGPPSCELLVVCTTWPTRVALQPYTRQ